MSAGWKLFRVVCVLQLLATVFYALITLINFVQTGSFNLFFKALCFGLMAWLSVFALVTLKDNYPDEPVSGTQKSIFNWLFLLNFLLFAFLFALIIAEYRQLSLLIQVTGGLIFHLSFELLLPLIVFIVMFIFQVMILYGLYVMRVMLYTNFRKKLFEFENENL